MRYPAGAAHAQPETSGAGGGTDHPWIRRVESRLADRLAQRQLRALSDATAGGRAPTFWWRLAMGLAVAPIYLGTLLILGAGTWLTVTGSTWPLRAVGILLLLLIVAVRPAVSRRPDDVIVVTREEAPLLHALVERIAQQVGSPAPREIGFDPGFNAYVTRFGWRQRRLLVLGASLWAALPPQPRVALLGHELGHFAHGDLLHTRWVGYGDAILLGWYRLAGDVGVTTDFFTYLVARYLMAPWRGVILAYRYVLITINGPANQRQESMADLAAAVAAGTEAAVTSFDAMLCDEVVNAAVTRVAMVTTGAPDHAELWTTVGRDVAAALAEDPSRRRALHEKDLKRIDASHPATTLRIELLLRRPPEEATVLSPPAEAAAIDQQLEPVLLDLARRVVRDKRSYH